MRAPPGPAGLCVGIDIGATKTAILFHEISSGRNFGEHRFATQTDVGPDRLLTAIWEELQASLAREQRGSSEIRAIGFAIPGRVDDQGQVLFAGKLEGWTNVPLRERLTREWKAPIFVEQDANAAALGEHWAGVGKRLRNFVFLALGTGVGAGLFLDGRLYRGAHHAAGEFGDAILDRERLGRGEPGEHNLGALIGGKHIRAQARWAVGTELSAAESIQNADQDARLAPLADHVADYLALAVINIASLLDPEAIVFGGGTASAGEALTERVSERIENALLIKPALLLSELGESAQLYGALCGALSLLHDVPRAPLPPPPVGTDHKPK